MIICGKGIPGRDVRFGSIRSKALVSTLDIYPTVLSVAGIDIANLNRPGKNLIEIINDRSSAFRDAVFSELGTCVMIRTAKWKMVFDPEQGGVCYLFNLINDPKEQNNLAGVNGYESVTAELTAQLLSKYISVFQSTQGKEQIRLQKVRVKYKD
jgi:arylsulfatase A-like enzyme